MSAPSSSEHRLEVVQTMWQKAALRLLELGLRPDDCPRGLVVTSEHSLGKVYGEVSPDGQLCITKEALDDSALFHGIVARECARSALRSDSLCAECITDVATEFAAQQLCSDERARWRKTWQESSDDRRVNGVIVYSPAAGYEALYDVAGPDGLKSIIRDVFNASRYGVRLEFNDYAAYFETRFRRFSVGLTAAEVRILDAMLRDPSATYQLVAQRTGFTPQWVTQRIASLENRRVLRSWETVHFSKIGIRMFHLFIGEETGGQDPYRYFVNCPFVYAIRRVLTGDWHTLATLSVPDNNQSIRAVYHSVKQLGQRGVRVEIYEIVSSGAAFCFDYYLPESGAWQVPWDLERVQLPKIHRERLWTAFPRIDSPTPKTRVTLDELDMRVIEATRRGVNSVASLRGELRVGQTRVASSLRKLRENDILYTAREAHNVGLNEHIVLTADEQELGRAIAAWSQRLPRTIPTFDLDGRLTLLCSLPTGGSYGLASCLEMVEGQVSLSLLGSPLHGKWRMPLETWNAARQAWDFPDREVTEWLDSMR
ncbi:MAG: hypothetical protein HXY34_00060 [Candidatus Thorarchaeota archaeon]|nr:hypothetical protein [Candidatus Thorarchaeota archaeon]